MATPFDTSFNNGDVIQPSHVKQYAAPINALEAEIESKGQPNGLASLDATGKVPASQLPASGGGGANSLDDLTDVAVSSPTSGQVLKHNGAEFVNSALAASDVPNLDAGKITSGTLPIARGGTGATSAGAALTNLGAAAASHTHSISDVTNLQTSLDAKQSTSEKGAAGGYASLGIDGKVPASQLPASGGGGADSLDDLTDVVISSPSSGQVLRHNGTEFVNASLGAGDMPSGIDASKLGSGSVSNAELAYLDGVTSSVQTQLDGKAASAHTHVISDVTNLQTNLNAKQDTSAKNAASGYAGLDASSKLAASQMSEVMPLNGLSDVSITTPSTGQMVRFNGTTWVNAAPAASDLPSGIDAAKIGSGAVSNAEFGYLDGVTSSVQTQLDGKAAASHTHPISDVTNLQTNLDAKEDKSAKGAVNGYASLDSSGKVPAAQLPAGGGGASSLDELSDVAISSPASGQVLRHNGTQFVNSTLTAANMPSGIDAARIGSGAVSNAEFGYLDGVLAPIQSQINGRVSGTCSTGYLPIMSGPNNIATSHGTTTKIANVRNVAGGQVVYWNSSSQELTYQFSRGSHKENIRKIETTIDDLMNWRPVEFEWKENFGGVSDIGLIAEEVASVYPLAATYDQPWDYVNEKTGEYTFEENGSPKRLGTELVPGGVKYEKAWIPMMAAVQDFYQRYQASEARAEALEARVMALEKAQ